MLRAFRLAAVAAMVLSPPAAATCAESRSAGLHPGDTFEVRLDREMSMDDNNGSTGSSTDRDVIVERVISVRDGGVELEFDLPRSATAQERAQSWEFPARVFAPAHGAMRLLNAAELKTRVDAWLKAAELPQTACGHWTFTWNAFRIECDPQSVVEMLRAIDLNAVDPQDGAPYSDPHARGPVSMRRREGGPGGPSFVAEMDVDPDAVRREKAQSDVVVSELMRQPKTLETALQERAKYGVSGTISVTFDTGPAGEVRRRTTVTRVETRRPDGRIETETVTQTVDRRLVSRPRG